MTAKTVTAEVSLLGKIAGYIEILVKDPHSTVFVPLADAYRKMGLTDEAITVARKGTEAVPHYAPGFITLARALAENGDVPGAAQAFKAALEIEPELVPALTGLARVHLLGGDREPARALLVKAAAFAPDDELVKRMLASLGTPPAAPARVPAAPAAPAAAPSESAVAETGEPPIATATLADIYIRQGLPEKALKVYRDILQAAPDNVELRTRYEELRRKLEGEAVLEPAPTPLSASVTDQVPLPSPAVPEPGRDSARQMIAACERWLVAVERRRAHVR